MEAIIKINVESLVFDCHSSGDNKDPLILFLHGFPETAFMWKPLMKSFAEKGFYCVAPNQRGYSKGACPKGKKHYRIEALVADVVGIAEALNKSEFHLVGHDWGAVIGWNVVYHHPDKVLSWTALSVPHMQAFGKAMTTDPEQKKMSQYIKGFQLPFLPEMRIMKNDLKLFKRLWKYHTIEEKTDYLTVFRNRNQLTAALNYYRANYKLLKSAKKGQILGNIDVPTLFIWGNKDIALGKAGVDGTPQFMKNDYQFVALDAGHWLIQTEFEKVKTHVMKFIQKLTTNKVSD